MRNFLGRHLEEVFDNSQEVETEGRNIIVTGPLSEAFTQALQLELNKKEGEVTPVVESFTDPKVIAKLLKEEAENKKRGTVNPMTVYAFDRSDINQDTIVEAALTAAQAKDTDDFYVVSDQTKEDKSRPRFEVEYYEKALEAIVEKMGGHYIGCNSNKLRLTLESRDQNG